KPKEEFDLIDQFIANYGIDLAHAEEVVKMDSKEIANMILTPSVPRSEIVKLTKAMTPAKIVEVVSHMNVVEIMMAVQKMRTRKQTATQSHVTNVNDNPIQIA
ncbi:propanediol/glycerol family dehydratase large subunit, partial [Streptococcus suis]